MRYFAFVFLLLLFCCNTPGVVDTKETEVKHSSSSEINKNLDNSLVSLNKTIIMMEQMTIDLELMNRNLDAIFRAVTDCESDVECEELSKMYIKKYEEDKKKSK